MKTLSRATKGYLCKSSLTLSIATKGYLCINKSVEIIDKPFKYKNNSSNTKSPILKSPILNRYDLVRQENDDTILLIIKIFIECQENA
jgi:hypothetical protein